jgi:O-antigen/teichoic acid export membrane protein
MLSGNTIITIASKFIILLLNFALVVFSTHLWGSAGRGEIALIIAYISVIILVSNVFCGSTVSYHASKLDPGSLLTLSFLGAFLISLCGGLLFSVFLHFKYFPYLFGISLLLSLTTSISSYWLGKSNIIKYNILTLLLPLLFLTTLTVMSFFLKIPGTQTYFKAYFTGSCIVLFIGVLTIIHEKKFHLSLSGFSGIRSILEYGIKNEFNSLLQFLSNRLSYIFILKFLGISLLGIFSVAIAISEAVLVISRSLSAIHFSNVLRSDDRIKSQTETRVLVRQSIIISILSLVIVVMIPESVFQFIFGKEFWETRRFIIFMIPGTVSIAAANIYDQYFSGTGNLKVIRKRSFISLGLTLITMPVLISQYNIIGICISINISGVLSAIYIWRRFMSETKPDN